jgi:hypothetical protein
MESLIEKMESSLKQRRKADAVRFVYDAEMPQHLLDFLVSKFSLGKYDSLIPGGRYHNSKDFMAFPSVGPKYLELKPLPVIRLPEVEAAENILAAIRVPGCPALLPLSPLRLRDRSSQDRGNGPAGREHQHLSVSRGAGVAHRRCAAQRGAQRQEGARGGGAGGALRRAPTSPGPSA